MHPTEKGTKQILESLQEKTNKSIIRNEKLVTNKYSYTGVQTAYTFGCSTCFATAKRGKKMIHCADCMNLLIKAKHEKLMNAQSDHETIDDDDDTTYETKIDKDNYVEPQDDSMNVQDPRKRLREEEVQKIESKLLKSELTDSDRSDDQSA